MITRENYEEFFILYVDNELSAAARSAVATFVEENPDLREEWEAFLQCRVEPEDGLAFPYKNELLRAELSLIDAAADDYPGSDHESLFLSYIDGELDAKDRARVEDLISREPSKALALRQLSMTVNEPDLSIVFLDKESLYRTERRRRVVPLFWMRAGVAAAVLGVGAMLFLNRPHGNGSVAVLPAVVTEKKDAGPVTPHSAAPLYNVKASATAQKVKQEMTRSATAQTVKQEIARRTGKPQSQELAVKSVAPKDRFVAPPVSSTDTSRDFAIAPTTKPDRTEALPVVNTVAVSIPKDQSSFATQALLKESRGDEAENIAADVSDLSAPAGKTKLRKIFRRVSRAFGKTADRDDDGQRQVLISAFQVALK
jgi:anti-sigma factor RsiW